MTDSPSVAWACLTCNSPRAVDPCPKCGTALTRPADGWEWPETPDVNRIRALAREVGYAVGVHGTLERDLDLIAVPWVADAVSPFDLAKHIATGLGGTVLDYKTQDKPCGRWSCNINADGWFKLIDLSVMPPMSGAGKTLGQRAYERMRDHNDNASSAQNSTKPWSDLSEDERREWNEDASERPYLYGLRRAGPIQHKATSSGPEKALGAAMEALLVARSQAMRGADKAGCDGWRAQEMCRQIGPLIDQALAAIQQANNPRDMT
ncbi:hypothetical protein GURKE_00390 [Brevundimonas phage vB_BpoS-Gurke]|uniref:Uncharacterized protein n=1 Tax=Brevundimonas phage vB_BpoS-Gurke TaxID=2948599 RepID=A0A9E7SRU6_9CAUD|nr:hypothetical protein GURKE_00390 [Brevundimonas phage vB_BpoS-Gurke]